MQGHGPRSRPTGRSGVNPGSPRKRYFRVNRRRRPISAQNVADRIYAQHSGLEQIGVDGIADGDSNQPRSALDVEVVPAVVDVRVLRREQLHRRLADQAAERRVTGIVHPRDTAGHRGLLVTARAEGEHDPKALPWPLSSAKPYFAILPCFFRKSEAFRVSILEPGAAGLFFCIDARMSDVGGKADVTATWPGSPFIAISRHSP